jgi:AcrR family transcriptional regulator
VYETVCLRQRHIVSTGDEVYSTSVPRLWNETIEGHRREVREAILDAVGSLVATHGLTSVTMSAIAESAGIGRATLYKYFADVDAVLVAWHERQVAEHLAHLSQVGTGAPGPLERLRAVLQTYAVLSGQHSGSELAGLLHRSDHVGKAQQQLIEFVEDLLIQAARAGAVRTDVAADELARYCLHALGAAHELTTPEAVGRLVTVTLAGLRAM